jgi:hypothetical protein
MKRLTVVGTTPNGDAIVLSDGKGAKFLVANDPRLAAVISPRQLEIVLHTFSPREIQARVRAGASAEIVAAETGWPLDKVLRYAEPLLAERAFIAEQAQAVEVRRSGGGSTLLATAYAAVGAEPDSEAITWDAWRRDDGKWVVTATYADRTGTRTAEWTYDHTGRNIHPLDDEARELMGVRRDDAQDDIAALTEALDLIADRPERDVEDIAARPRLVAVPDADDVVEAMPDAEQEPEKAPAYSEQTLTIPTIDPTTDDAPEPDASGSPAAAKKTTARKTKSRRGRASVPSWDEILFGATRTDD